MILCHGGIVVLSRTSSSTSSTLYMVVFFKIEPIIQIKMVQSKKRAHLVQIGHNPNKR